jgi:cystathionine beta-lyase/cystathionine gamma-synthase
MRLADVAALSALAKKLNVLHVCDATFATPAMMQPIKLGADVCVVSTTKFYCGHNMTVNRHLSRGATERVRVSVWRCTRFSFFLFFSGRV